MRSFHPSGRAAAVAAALAVTLVVAGTAGAVAGGLVTSKDIKDHGIKSRDLDTNSVRSRNIAPGSVTWGKSLSAATKAQIEALLGEGVPGPQGPAGDRGPTGPRGSDGADGTGDLVVWDYFVNGPTDEPTESPSATPSDEPSEPTVLEPLSGHTIQLDEPGNYLVTMRGVSLGGPVFLSLGEPDESLDILLNGCFDGLDEDIDGPFGVCNATYPVAVQSGESLTLPVYSLGSGSGSGCECDDAPVFASVAIYKINDDASVPPSIPLPRSQRKQLDKLSEQLQDQS